MSESHALPEYHDESGLYEIRIKGHLNNRYTAWFEGLTITLEDNGDTLLTGPVVDQAALHGLLKKVRGACHWFQSVLLDAARQICQTSNSNCI